MMLAPGNSRAGAASGPVVRIARAIPSGYWIAYLTIVGVSALSSLVLLAFGWKHPLPPSGEGSFPFVTFALTVVFLIGVLRPLWLVVRRHPAPTRQLIEDVQRHSGWLATVALMALTFQGLAAAHRSRAGGRLKLGWLAAIYLLLIVPLSRVVTMFVLASWGFIDNWFRPRRPASL